MPSPRKVSTAASTHPPRQTRPSVLTAAAAPLPIPFPPLPISHGWLQSRQSALHKLDQPFVALTVCGCGPSALGAKAPGYGGGPAELHLQPWCNHASPPRVELVAGWSIWIHAGLDVATTRVRTQHGKGLLLRSQRAVVHQSCP